MNSNKRGNMNFDIHLLLSISSGDNEEAQRILQEIDPCNLTDSSGQTLLHVSVEFNNKTITKYLIDAGCKVDATNKNGNTPLILACQQSHEDVIKILIEAKASVLIVNKEGKSAAKIVLDRTELDFGILDSVLERVKEECSNDSLRAAEELLRIGCSLTRATRLKDTAITEYMLDNGCNINDQDHTLIGWTPLHQALDFRDNENAKLLIDRGADVNVEDAGGMTPVSYACHSEILVILLNKGAKVVDGGGTLVAGDLFSNWQREVVEMLMSRYNLTDLTLKDRDGTTLFHHIISNTQFDPIEILQKYFDSSIDINQTDRGGSSAMFKALRAGNVKSIEFLLKMGAKTRARDVWLNELYYKVAENLYSWKKNREDRENILLLLLQYGTDIQWTSRGQDGYEYCMFDSVFKEKHFTMAKIILARLALVEVLGVEIKNLYREKVEGNAMCKKYFEFCKRTIEKLKRTVIKRRVTLFDFMTCSEETLVKFGRSEEFMETVQSIMCHKRRSNLYYYRVLRRRVNKAVKIVALRKHLSLLVKAVIPELQGNQIIIEKIIEYVTYDTLCSMTSEPTFRCLVDSE